MVHNSLVKSMFALLAALPVIEYVTVSFVLHAASDLTLAGTAVCPDENLTCNFAHRRPTSNSTGRVGA